MSFLKSINLAEDFHEPGRASHYRPTRKSLILLRAILGENGSKASNVIGAYGSGKSLASLVAGLMIKADPAFGPVLAPVLDRLAKTSPDLVRLATARMNSRIRGSVIVLSGHVPDLPAALAENMTGAIPGTMSESGKPVFNGPPEMNNVLAALLKYLENGKHDHLAIIWDEFGRHLEYLASAGQPEKLLDVQRLAEWTVRRTTPSVTFTLLSHQDFQRSSGRPGKAGQTIWRKVEGRFDPIVLIENSDEIYPFIADLACEATRERNCGPGLFGPDFSALARQSLDAGFFAAFQSPNDLESLLYQAWPLMPGVLWLLPNLSSRIGQNERSLFSFLEQAFATIMPGQAITFEHLFVYFAENLRVDTGPGGHYRRLIEVESARAKANSAIEREVLAAACLLQLGESGTRAHLPMEHLQVALAIGTSCESHDIKTALASLVDRKLLLHRKRSDDVSVWHGADIDLHARISRCAANLASTLDLADCLDNIMPAPALMAPEYNFKNGLTRYAPCIHVHLADLTDSARMTALECKADRNDALVALVIDATEQDLAELDQTRLEHYPHLIVALPRQPLDLSDALLEFMALRELAQDQELLALDPLIKPELLELESDAAEDLAARLEYLANPERGGVIWLQGGTPVDMDPENPEKTGNAEKIRAAVQNTLIDIFTTRFPDTPTIKNRQIVRRHVTTSTRSARKRCVLGILERSGIPDLGYETATSADASIYRTIFKATGLYRGNNITGDWQREPENLDDPGLAAVWTILRDFLSTPARQPKSFRDLVKHLTGSPVGLRDGVVPLMIAAGLKAFGSCLALRENRQGQWIYIDDIRPGTLEAIADQPDLFELEVISVSKRQNALIRQLTGEFHSGLDIHEQDLLRAFYDAVLYWRANLPPAAFRARGLGHEASALQRVLRQTDHDPAHLLFRAFPDIASRDRLDAECAAYISRARQQMERLTEIRTGQAIEIAKTVLGGSEDPGNTGDHDFSETVSLLDIASVWAGHLPVALDTMDGLDHLARALISRARQALNDRYDEAGWIRACSVILTGTEIDNWDDTEAREFERSLRRLARDIETAVLSLEDGTEGLSLFLERRIRTLVNRHAKGVDRKATLKFMQDLSGEI